MMDYMVLINYIYVLIVIILALHVNHSIIDPVKRALIDITNQVIIVGHVLQTANLAQHLQTVTHVTLNFTYILQQSAINVKHALLTVYLVNIIYNIINHLVYNVMPILLTYN